MSSKTAILSGNILHTCIVTSNVSFINYVLKQITLNPPSISPLPKKTQFFLMERTTKVINLNYIGISFIFGSSSIRFKKKHNSTFNYSVCASGEKPLSSFNYISFHPFTLVTNISRLYSGCAAHTKLISCY